jgi:methyltransferase
VLLAALGALGVLRLAELAYARWTAAGLLRRGGRLVRDDGMGLIVAVHALFFAACLAEGIVLQRVRLGWWTWAGAAAFAAGTLLRYASMAALGPRWSTRVWVVPGEAPVRSGPYRFLRHPIYLGVALELAGLPLAFGLWGTLLAVGILHLAALARRIRREEAAWAGQKG